ncbi:hypothetical protein [Bradyrhizobium sp. Cp5.3]|uniref:hypothetical protein n=1 Tax=Bradyrhizobium sp. Cp5.3 TaxID=443598 RepID=UPI000485C2E1|nr:hypothetical protein [Bradyrhizobium sp. Cp5.3]
MSAIITLAQSDRVHILTDGAAYRPDGTITHFTQKVRAVPHLELAFAMRGAAIGFGPIAEEIQAAATSFDWLRTVIVPLIKACSEAYANLLQQCEAGPDFEVVVAGISETTGPSAYLVASHGRYGEPWIVHDLPGLVALPCDEEILHGIRTIVPPGASPDDVDPAREGVAIMEIQRKKPNLDNGDHCVVGGFAQLTTIAASGISTRIIHRWDEDVVGQKVAA